MKSSSEMMPLTVTGVMDLHQTGVCGERQDSGCSSITKGCCGSGGLCTVCQVTVFQLNSSRNCNHEFTTYSVLSQDPEERAAWLSVSPSSYLSLQCV